MELILYNSSEIEFKTLGIGVLTDFSSIPKVTEVLKGEYILEFDYMKNGKYSEYLLNQNIIKALGQPFRIVSVDPSNDGYRVLAKHIYYDLKNNFLEDVAPTNKTAHEALKWVLERTVFSNNFIVSGDCTELASSRYVRTTPYDAFFSADNSILSRYGGEPEFDCLNIIIHQRRGKDSGVEIREGKNLSGIKISKDFSSIITKICPVGSDGLLLPEKYVDSPLIGVYDTPRIDKREFSDIGVNEETSEEEAFELLRNACNKLFDEGLDKPVIAVSVDFIELSKTKEYEKYQNLETLELGDTLRVYIPSLKQDYSIRVIKIVKNALTGTITNLELGNEIPSLITYQSKVNSSIANDIKKSHQSALSKARDDLTKFINHPYNGHLIISEETGEIFILDTTDVSTAKEVWKFGLGGWGFSSYGIDGPYESGLTKDGHFVADWITTGKMSAERIEGLSQLILTVKSLEEEQETSKQASGNPIEVKGAGEYNLESIGIDGKSYQETSTGKNKFINIESATYAGITLTHNSDDSYDIVGTSTSTGNIFFQKDIAIEKSMLKDNAYYTMSLNQGIDTAKILIVSEFYGNGQYKRRLVSASSGYRIGLCNLTDVDTFRCYIMIKVGQTVNIKGLKIQVEEGQVATDIEPYTGGIPSPNPEYPQEIKTVQGITNLFDVNEYTLNNQIITRAGNLSIEDDELVLNCTGSDAYVGMVNASSGVDYTDQYGKLFEINNTIYSIMVTNPQFTKNYIQFWDKDKKSITPYQAWGGQPYITFTLPSNAKYATFRFGKGPSVSGEELRTKVILVKGKMPERYVPYGRWLEQITCGRQLFNKLKTTDGFYKDEQGNNLSQSTTCYSDYIRLFKGEEYHFKGRGTWQSVAIYDLTHKFKKQIAIADKYVATEDEYVVVNLLIANKDTCMIYHGQYSGEYEEYKENTALIDMNKDNLFDKNNANILNAYATINTPVITSNENFRTLYVPCESNTIYTIEKIASTRFSVSYTTELPSIGISVNNIVQNNTANKEIYQTGNNAKYLVILYYNTTTDTLSEQDILDSIKIYEGCEPYYEFAEVEDERDKFLDRELVKNISKIVLTGNENWIKSSIKTGDRFLTSLVDSSSIPENVMSTHFHNEGYNIGHYVPNTCFIGIYQNKPSLFLDYSEYGTTTLAQFKNFLQEQYNAGTPVIIYYILDEPKTYQLKYEPLKLHKGYNYITLNDGLYPNMEIKYLTDSKFNAEYATKSELNMKSNEIMLGVNGKLENYSTTTETNALIDAKVEEESASINLSVTQKINDIQIGGTNLLLGTEKPMSSGNSSGTNQTNQLYKFSDFFNTNYKSKIDTDEGLLVTCSFDWETTGTSGSFLIMLMGWPYTALSKTITVSANAKKGHSEITTTMKKVANNYTNFSYIGIRRDNMTTSVKISNMKIELGNKATDWSSAPEDKLDISKFNKAEIIAEINSGVSSITINADNINQNGLATFMNTNLMAEGKTTINGSNIITGTIDASKVTVTNLNADNITSGTITGRTINGGTITGSVFKGETDGVKLQIGTDSNGDNYSNNSLELVKESDNSIILSIFGKFWTLANKAVYFRTTGNNFVFMDGNVSCNQLNSTSIKCNSITPQSGDNLGIDGSLEIRASTGYIDFHKDNSGTDYTARIIERNQGEFQFLKTGGYANCRGGQWINSSSKLVKKNIEEISEEEAKGLLNIKAVSFDYKNGITNNQRGFIAENILDEMPDYVIVPKDYDASKFDDTKDDNGNIDITQEVPSLDYSKFVVPLVKLCQMQQKQIDDLIERIKKLESR